MIIMDAFTSDIIPPHLVSEEALQLYLSKLNNAGILVLNITNVHVALEPVLAGLAAEAGLICLSRFDMDLSEQELLMGKLATHYTVLARNPDHIAPLIDKPSWTAA
jgi:hypothetical protein